VLLCIVRDPSARLGEVARTVSFDQAVRISPLMETMKRFEAAHERGLVDATRACFHDGAIIESVASEGAPLTADATAEALREALSDGVYAIGDWSYEEIDPEVVLSWTTTRHRANGRGVQHETIYRLTSGRDGLMWRVKLFSSRDEALAYVEQNGPALEA
jgi:hypothetical protein